MKIWAISDLHLSFFSNKPMAIFGDKWKDHEKKIKLAWEQLVSKDDVVICPGDTSWGTKLKEVEEDLSWIGKLPGSKILIKGNHDYWWTQFKKVKSMMPPSCFPIQNNAITVRNFVVAGGKGCPSHDENLSEKDKKIYNRELVRLKLSLDYANKIAPSKEIIVAMHFPPFSVKKKQTAFTSLIEKHNVKTCIYGHLHGKKAFKEAPTGNMNGIKYHLISSDYLDFVPKKIYS